MKNLNFFTNGRHSRNFVLIQWQLRKVSAVERKLTNKSLKEKCEVIQSEDILEQFQIQNKTANDVAPERPSRLAVESALDVVPCTA